MKPLVIYHASCTDGFGAAYSAWTALGNDAVYVPLHYGTHDTEEAIARLVDSPARERDVYVLDFSLKRPATQWLCNNARRFIWLDHHKTAFEMWCPGYEVSGQHALYMESTDRVRIHLDGGRSGALLAWDYFHPETSAPQLILHIDDRDRWQFAMDGSREVHAGLNMTPFSFEEWHKLAQPGDTAALDAVIEKGRAVLEVNARQIEQALRHAMPVTIDGAQGLGVNCTVHISEIGHELAIRSGTFGLVWYMANDKSINCSLRSNGDYDVSAIAKKFGGGGHKNAAGFRTDMFAPSLWGK